MSTFICPKCNLQGMAWDGRAKVLACHYLTCHHVVRMPGQWGIPSDEQILKAIERDKNPAKRPDVREKIRESHQGKKNPMFGRKHSVQTIEKMKEVRRRNKNKPKRPHPDTCQCSSCRSQKKDVPEHRAGCSCYCCRSQKGDHNSNWKGGSSFLPYPTTWTEDLRESIRKRDNHTCQLCGKTQEQEGKKLPVHHINYDKGNLDPKNLVSLCHRCHVKTNGNRSSWAAIFQERMKG